MDQLRIYAAYWKLRDARLAEIQSGGKAVTRAEEKQLKLKLFRLNNFDSIKFKQNLQKNKLEI